MSSAVCNISVAEALTIDAPTVRHLIASQFPHWASLDVQPVIAQGWSNIAFRLGRDKLVRLPKLAAYEPAIEKECLWLPKLAPHLSLAIPLPVVIGKPQIEYSLKCAVFQWIEGETAGYAGGIMSAGVDGIKVAEAVALSMLGSTITTRHKRVVMDDTVTPY